MWAITKLTDDEIIELLDILSAFSVCISTPEPHFEVQEYWASDCFSSKIREPADPCLHESSRFQKGKMNKQVISLF
jgi:hypothetical protein